MDYPIQVNLIPGLPQGQYDNGHYIGVVAHATATNGDSADSERNYESLHWREAFVHAFVDDQKIEQVADFNYVAYGAGRTANHSGYAQVELCQSTDPNKFAAAYARYVWLLAKLLHDRKLGVVDGVTLMSHAQVSAKWKQSDHTDPIEYLASHGKAWSDLVRDVTRVYNEMEVTQVDKAILIFGPDDLPTARRLQGKIGNCAVFFRNADTTAPADVKAARQLYVVGGSGGVGHPNEVLLQGADWFKTADAVAKYLG